MRNVARPPPRPKYTCHATVQLDELGLVLHCFPTSSCPYFHSAWCWVYVSMACSPTSENRPAHCCILLKRIRHNLFSSRMLKDPSASRPVVDFFDESAVMRTTTKCYHDAYDEICNCQTGCISSDEGLGFSPHEAIQFKSCILSWRNAGVAYSVISNRQYIPGDVNRQEAEGVLQLEFTQIYPLSK